MDQTNLWHLAKRRVQVVKEYSNHEILKQNIPKIYEWAKKNKLIIHGGHAVHLQLLHKHNKGLYNNDPSSVDLYYTGKNLSDVKEMFEKDFKGITQLVGDTLNLIIDDMLIATVIKRITDSITIPEGLVIPIEYSISIYWSILNGHVLQLYNKHLSKYARYLLKIADIMGKDLPKPYEFISEPKYKYPIDIGSLKHTYITGQNAVDILTSDTPKFDQIELACFEDPQDILDKLKGSPSDYEWVPSANWGLIPGYFHSSTHKIKVYDCSTMSSRVISKHNVVCLMGVAAFHPGGIAMRVLSTMYKSDRFWQLTGDTAVGKGVAEKVMAEIMDLSGVSRLDHTSNIDYLKHAVQRLV